MTAKENCYLALCFDNDEEYKTYIEQLSERLATETDSVVLLNNRGLAFLESGRDSEAKADFERACSLTSAEQESVPYQNLAVVLMALEDFSRAIEVASQVIAAHPNEPIVYYTRHRVYKAAGQEELAAHDLAKFEELHRARTAGSSRRGA